ncbi:MAG: hypothetical protein BGO14_08545 [Chlamydiales bacterium 38-26]|nr:DUF4065 domain-containing protein [Chlamydiales bacterium]OJV11037.1 MAG: hypothetical protein BGO14_08545 [Chlamydiales bacterium 38-26]
MSKVAKKKIISAFDVVAYILANKPKNCLLSAWKLHKLLYYCQTVYIIKEGCILFHESILAWPKGPAIKELCKQHYGNVYIGDSSLGNINHLSLKQCDIIHTVLETYGLKTEDELNSLIFLETPWKQARNGLDDQTKGPALSFDSLIN